MKRTLFLNSPEFARIRAHVLVTLTAWGALMVVAMKVQFETAAWAEDASPVSIVAEHDRTPAVQNDAFAELVKRAARGLGAAEGVAHRDMMDRPGEVRGKVARWEGVFVGDLRRLEVEPVPLVAGEAPPDVSKACEGVVLDPVSGMTVAAMFLEPGPKPPAHGRIVFEGAFWKVATWTNRRGDVVAAPYLVAPTWTLTHEERPAPVLPILMGITGGIAIASIVIGAQASRRQSAWKNSTGSAK